jgi:hypothetical protein
MSSTSGRRVRPQPGLDECPSSSTDTTERVVSIAYEVVVGATRSLTNESDTAPEPSKAGGSTS